ncbi:MAG: hypothetical protein D6685_01430 [Bacteroidetes bacterium]|nr:hypothetical protein AWN76_003720 [Rhodothermaceae bacterium RA]RMH69276.1 MAG: hypothetical protein D6685_01430 [Bacteroidota bacterium]
MSSRPAPANPSSARSRPRRSGGDARLASHLLLRSNRFRYAGRRTPFGRAYLYGDRIELHHWTWRGRCVRRIPLTQILDLDYHPLDGRGNLSLELERGGTLHLVLDEAHRWREHFEQWLSYTVLPSAKLLGPEGDQAASVSG